MNGYSAYFCMSHDCLIYMPIHLRVSLSDAICYFTICHESCYRCIASCIAYAIEPLEHPPVFVYGSMILCSHHPYNVCPVMNVYMFSVYLLLLL
jgi:hypothetical protein